MRVAPSLHLPGAIRATSPRAKYRAAEAARGDPALAVAFATFLQLVVLVVEPRFTDFMAG